MSDSLSSHVHPPRFASKFLAWALPTAIKEPVLGDLEEAFSDKCHQHGMLNANLWYLRQALFSGFSFILQTQRSVIMFILAMVFFLLITLFAMSMASSIDVFIDVPSFLLIVPPALVLTCGATSYRQMKQAFLMLINADGAYDKKAYRQSQQVFSILGNSGLILGIFMMLIGFVSMGALMEGMEIFGKAASVACICLVYGLAIKLQSYIAEQKMINIASELE